MADILLIEDDLLVSELLCDLLVYHGHEVRVGANGIEGIKLFKEKQPDLIITDIYMPEKNGIETILELVNMNSDIKIIAISGGGNYSISVDIMEHAEIFGAIPTLDKPVDHTLLLSTIDEMLTQGA